MSELALDIESQLNLQRDTLEIADLVIESEGAISCDASFPGAYWLRLRPKSDPGELYFVRVHWARYPHEPPSVKFATGLHGQMDVTRAWPLIPGYRPGNFDICQPFTREGFTVHPEWSETQERWRVTGNPFLWVVMTLQNDLDNRYQGRSG